MENPCAFSQFLTFTYKTILRTYIKRFQCAKCFSRQSCNFHFQTIYTNLCTFTIHSSQLLCEDPTQCRPLTTPLPGQLLSSLPTHSYIIHTSILLEPLDHEKDSNIFLRNIQKYWPNNTVLLARSLKSSNNKTVRTSNLAT